MKISSIVLLTLLFSLLIHPNFLSTQTNLSQTSDMSELPFIIIRPNGEVMVAWTEGHFNLCGVIWYRIYTEKDGWSAPKIAAQKLYSAAFPQLAIDNNGDIHMAYMDGNSSGNREIYYKKYLNGQWSEKERVGYSPGYNSSWPRIDVEGNKIYIVWCHNHTPPGAIQGYLDVVIMEKVDGGSWPYQYQNISNHQKSVSIHPFFKVKDGNVYAVWMDDNHKTANWNIYYNERINGSWKSPVHLAPGINQYMPALDVDDNVDVHIIYSNKTNPVWYMKKTYSGWTSPLVISTTSTSITTAVFMKYHQGILHAVWRQREGEGNYIFYSRGTINGQWETPIKVSHGGQSECPGLDIDSMGRVHVVYSDIGVGGERDIFYVRVDQITSYPVASFTASPTQGDPPLQVSFDASGSYDPDGNISSYKWDFGDNSTGSGIKVSHTYQEKGVYSATLTVTDNEDQSSSLSKDIIVGKPPVASFEASPLSGGPPLEVKFNASYSYDPDGNIVSYSWNFGDGAMGTGKTVTHVYTKIGTYIATLTVKDDDGLEDRISQEIKIVSGPIARFTANPKKGQAPLTVNFDASNSKPSENSEKITSYEWDFGDESKGTGEKVTHTYYKYGTFIVTLKVTDDKSLIDSTTKEINVFSKPKAIFSCSPTWGIAPLQVNFDASASYDSDGKIISYNWIFGDGTAGEGKNASHTYNFGGIFTITLTVIDNDGYTDSTTKSIEVIDKPFPPINIKIIEVINEGLLISDYINLIEWSKNPENEGKFNIVKYRIYRKKKTPEDSTYIRIAEVGNTTFEFIDAGFSNKSDMRSYIYGVSAIDDKNRESLLGESTSASLSPIKSKKNSQKSEVILK